MSAAGWWECTACDGENPPGHRFCGHCGRPAEDVAAGVSGPEERRVVTSLFADISGFTTLADEVEDAEALHDIISPVITRLAEIAERYGGFIAKYAGDALLVFFGAPVAHEDDPARALLVALEMHERLPTIVADLPAVARRLQLHVGVNTGRVISGRFGGELQSDYSILGDAVILAQRLESVAPSGSTYVGERTYDLTKDLFAFEDVGLLELKGKTRPVRAWRLAGRRSLPAIVGTSTTGPRTPLIGREVELRAIEAVLAALRRRRGSGLVSIVGEPGVGKSRLLNEVRALAARGGVRWYQIRCLSYGTGLAYWPYADLVRQLAGIAADDGSDVVVSKLRVAMADVPGALPYFARLLGLDDVDGALAGLAPDAFRRGLHQGFRDWITALAAGGPLLIVIEDVHWIDDPSTDLTAELAALGRDGPVLVCVTGRPEAEARVRALVERGRVASHHHVDLRPLTAAEVAVFLAALLGADPPSTLVDFVVERTGGNPLFVGETVRALRELQALVPVGDGEGWRLRPGWDPETLPSTIEQVVAARIDLLPTSASRALGAAAVIGRVVRRTLLEAVTGDAAAVDAALARLLDAGLLEPTVDAGQPAVMFHHALVQDVAYRRMLRRQRVQLHRRVAEVAEGLYGAGDDVIDLLARHLYLGEAGDRSLEYLVRAGDRAAGLFANGNAIMHLRRAAEVAEGSRDLADTAHELMLRVAELENVAGNHAECERICLEIGKATDDPRAWRALAVALRRQGEYDRALHVIEHALSSPGIGEHDAACLGLERGWALSNLSRYREAVEAFGEALAFADDEAVRGQLLTQMARAEGIVGHHEKALRYATEAETACERSGDLRSVTSALRILGDTLRFMGRLDDAVAVTRRALALAERTGAAEEKAGLLVNFGLVLLACGEVDEAIACDRQALADFEQMGLGPGQAMAFGNLAEKLLVAGRLDEARRYCDRAIDKATDLGLAHLLADVTRTLARILLAQGAAGAAGGQAELAAARFLEVGDREGGRDCLELAAEAAAAAGDVDRAEALSARARADELVR